ncbi:heme-binding protein [Nocardia sp. NPDC059240]|uniref:GlcG/HbpS family heme-binding protein n=1 Tax=Nocardia sp. NPDC059240 TaxID=3346786 RepID=UPI0036B18A20
MDQAWSAQDIGSSAMALTLNEARAVSDRVREHAIGLGAAVTIAIVDDGGHLQVLDRMDGASPMSARIAPAKASSVAMFRRDGNDLMRLQEAFPAVFAQIVDVAGTPIVAGGAARLIRRDGVVVGAIAIAGGSLEEDEKCAEVGVGNTV